MHHPRAFLSLSTLVLSSLMFSACSAPPPAIESADTADAESIVFLSVTSDAKLDPQAVDMAMKLAGFSLDEGRKVVMFFNVKGVTIPATALPQDLAFQDNAPIQSQLSALIKRGVDVHVCPICMQALGVQDGDLIDGAKVTTRASLFANIGTGTTVFTY